MDAELTRRGFIGGGAALLSTVAARSYAVAVGAGKPNLKFGVLSDIHISPAAYMAKYLKGDPKQHRPRETDLFEKALRHFDERGADAVVIAGDLADWGLVGQMKAVTDCWWGMFPDGRSRRDGRRVELLVVLGNHDVAFRAWTEHRNYAIPAMGDANIPPEDLFRNDIPRHWQELFREPYSPIWQKTVKGYTFIGAHWDTVKGIPAVEPYMAEHGPALAGTKPFFFIQHPHPKDTCFGPDVSGHDAGYATRALSPYPNAVALSGHAHRPLTDDQNVWQGAFTSIGTATLDSLTLDRGRENGPRSGANHRYAMQRMHGRIVNEDVTFAAHGLFVDVYDGFIEVERREFVHGRLLGPNWVIPVPAGKNPPFSFETREAAGAKPGPFPDGAQIAVSRGDGVVRLEFPAARSAKGSSRALDYEVEATVEEADVKRILFRRFVYAPDVFLAPEGDGGKVIAQFGECLFPEGVCVRFTVRARDAFGHFNAPLYGTLGRVLSRHNPRQRWKAYDAFMLSSLRAPLAAEPEPDEYGGWRVKAADPTGFFRAQKRDGRWWMVDPLGNLFLSMGVAAFTPGGSARQKRNFKERFGSEAAWAKSEVGLLKENGFNTLGAWSQVRLKDGRPLPVRIPYTVILNVMRQYLSRHPPAEGRRLVLDARFDDFVEEKVSALRKHADDPYLIGYFIDNEIKWGEPALEGCFEPYLAKVRDALRKYDPNHLNLGCRFNNWKYELSNERMFSIAGRYMDIVSVNHYGHWQPSVETFRQWEKWSGKPIMVTEFYTKGEDTGLPNATGGGWRVHTQDERGIFYENFVNELLKSGVCVGWHWFKYMDNDPTDLTTDPSNRNSNKGIVAWNFARYDPLLRRMQAMNGHVYGLIHSRQHRSGNET